MNNEEKADLVTLVDEDGNEHNFAVIDILPVNMKQYAILVPVNYDEEDEEDELILDNDAYIFRIDEVEGEETLVEVDDEEEWNKVATEWESRVQAFEQESNGEVVD